MVKKLSEMDQIKVDLAIAKAEIYNLKESLTTVYEVRKALGWNEYTSLSLVVDGVKSQHEALKKIAGGFINSECFMSVPPDWHSAFDQLQKIAKLALQ